MKIKHLKEWCNTKDDEDIVFACEYSYSSETYDMPTSIKLWVRPPTVREFKHTECANYEEIDIKGKKRKYCNKRDDFLNEYDSNHSCSDFTHKDNKIINFCRECQKCHKTYRHCKYVKNYEQIYVGNGHVRKD